MIERSYGFCYIVLNAATYLDFSLASIMKLVQLNPKSGIVIVEGADKFTHQLEKTDDGFSIDGTREICEKWVDRYPGRIIYHRLGNINDKRESRNTCLDLIRNNLDVQYIFSVDGDELIKPDDFIKIDSIIAEHPNHLAFWLKHHMFWGDFFHRYTDSFAGVKECIFYNAHNLNYGWWHTQVSLPNSQPILKFMPESVFKLDIPFYHYGYLTSTRRMFMKRLYSFHQNWWYAKNLNISCHQSSGLELWKNFFRGQPFEKEHWAEIQEFALEDHPVEIQSHPWFGKPADEIWMSDEMYPTFTISD